MSQKSYIFSLIVLLVIGSAWAVYFSDENSLPDDMAQPEKISAPEPDVLPAEVKNIEEGKSDFLPPLTRTNERVTKKPFGIFITPQTSPVSPEKFSGYHTGTDFEIFPDEESAEVEVKAVCGGKLIAKRTVTGYGGVAVESCELNGEPITVVYGHLKLASINFNVGEEVSAGDTLGILGRGYSAETGGERKHLHLGLHKGVVTNILGYVQNKSALSGWLDACQFVCN